MRASGRILSGQDSAGGDKELQMGLRRKLESETFAKVDRSYSGRCGHDWRRMRQEEGGRSGATGEFQLVDGTPLHPKRTVVLDPDALLVISLPGGGGFGSSLERDPQLVRDDVLDGLVSAVQAHDVYGVALRADGTVDDVATEQLRVQAP